MRHIEVIFTVVWLSIIIEKCLVKSGLDGLLIGSICLDYVGSWAHVGLLDLAGGDLVELELQDQEGEEDRYVDANDDHIIVRVTRRVQVK